MNLPIVEDWKQFPRWASTWVATATAAWIATPEADKLVLLGYLGLPAGAVPGILLASAFMARLWSQQKS